jgi:metallo-beta-lactamase class B
MTHSRYPCLEKRKTSKCVPGWFSRIGMLVAVWTLAFAARSEAQRLSPGWGVPFPPFHIAGNLYYVGDQDLASYLIATPKGLIVINSGVKEDVPIIKKSVETLGFHYGDIKILLISHAHFDHAEGSAMIIKETGAKYFVMEGDVPLVESGGKSDFQYGREQWAHFPPVKVDRVLHDGDEVELGGAVLVAHLTAGHTKGTTTWAMDESEGGKTLHVVIIGSPNVNPGYKLMGNKEYPQIAADYLHAFEVLQSLPCDIFLGAHGGYFGMKEKYQRLKAGDQDAFIDPAGYQRYVQERKQAFETELKHQQNDSGFFVE